MTEKTLKKLAQLLEQDQFELIFPEDMQAERRQISEEKTHGTDIKLVYLMNDAAESFLVFRNARMTGEYHSEYQGQLQATMNRQADGYVMVVRQGATVLALFFEDIDLEVHLYEYAYTGHFWVKKYEYLRQLEYRLAILRDKRDYLGEEYCTEEEKELSVLVEFPPLNYCCYPAVPEKYIVPRENPWIPSEKAIIYMKKLAVECRDVYFEKMLETYRKRPTKFRAKRIAAMLHKTKHAAVVDHLTQKLQDATKGYKRRFPERGFRKSLSGSACKSKKAAVRTKKSRNPRRYFT